MFAPPELHETGTIRKHWKRATVYAETKRVHEQLSEICALECGLKNCAMLCVQQLKYKHIMVLLAHTVGLSLENVSKRLVSDMTQESLLQQCKLDSQRANVLKRDENVGREKGGFKTIEKFVCWDEQAYNALEENL